MSSLNNYNISHSDSCINRMEIYGKCDGNSSPFCMHQRKIRAGVSRSVSMNDIVLCNHNNIDATFCGHKMVNESGNGGGFTGVTTLHATAKVLFGSVFAVSAMNSKLNKKSD